MYCSFAEFRFIEFTKDENLLSIYHRSFVFLMKSQPLWLKIMPILYAFIYLVPTSSYIRHYSESPLYCTAAPSANTGCIADANTSSRLSFILSYLDVISRGYRCGVPCKQDTANE